MREAYYLVGWGLIGVGSLFLRAVFSNMKDADTAVSTLWGLLVVGLVAGFILLKVANAP